MMTETFRKFLEDYNKVRGNLKIYSNDEEGDSLCIAIANEYHCLLIGDDSDYFIPALPKGYAPFQFLDWSGNGDPVTGTVYHRDLIAESFGISPELMIAIPALTGNDTMPNLIEKTAPKQYICKEKSQNNTIELAIEYLKNHKTIQSIEEHLKCIGENMLQLFRNNLQRAHEKYDPKPFKEEELQEKICLYLKSRIGIEYPEWLIQQYMHFNFTKGFF